MAAVQKKKHEWHAEVAIPIKSLVNSKIDINNLYLNCMSQNCKGFGTERIFLADPGRSFKHCRKFLPVNTKPPSQRHNKRYTVRFHFAEHEAIKIGQRCFDIKMQGKTVLSNFDILRESGGKDISLIKEFKGVNARELIELELIKRKTTGKMSWNPFINAIEIIMEN